MTIEEAVQQHENALSAYSSQSLCFSVIVAVIFGALAFYLIKKLEGKRVKFTFPVLFTFAIVFPAWMVVAVIPTFVPAKEEVEISNAQIVSTIEDQVKSKYSLSNFNTIKASDTHIEYGIKSSLSSSLSSWGEFDLSKNNSDVSQMNYIETREGDNVYRYYLSSNDGNVVLLKDDSSNAPDPSSLKK